MSNISPLDRQGKLRVLLTNTSIAYRTGSELFIRDVAVELLKRGHTPIVYSPRLGELAQELRVATIPVVDDLNSISVPPDIIHGHHHLETMTALSHFWNVPAVFFCHGILPWEEMPPIHPRILRYVAISEAIRDRMIYEFAIPEQSVTMFSGFVDLQRFKTRPSPLPLVPNRALIFSNYASEDNYVGSVREACRRHGISLDVVGSGYGTAHPNPENILGNYDLIFARGRAALESMAVGAAVICCDVEGAGSLVTSANLDWFRRNNLGIRSLNRPITVDLLADEISCYDANDAARVSQKIRATAGLSFAVDRILEIYEDVLTVWDAVENKFGLDGSEDHAVAAYLKWISKTARQTGSIETELNNTKAELENMRSTLTWKFRERMTSIPLIRNFYFWLFGQDKNQPRLNKD